MSNASGAQLILERYRGLGAELQKGQNSFNPHSATCNSLLAMVICIIMSNAQGLPARLKFRTCLYIIFHLARGAKLCLHVCSEVHHQKAPI